MNSSNFDFDKLTAALESHANWDFDEYYFDRNTGKVLSADALATTNSPKFAAVHADKAGFILIEPFEAHDIGDLMDKFSSMQEAEIREALESVFVTGGWRTPFLGFKEILSEFPEIDEQWKEFHQQYMQEVTSDWLRKHGIMDFPA